MVLSLDCTPDYPWFSAETLSTPTDYSPPVFDISAFTVFGQQPGPSFRGSGGTAATDSTIDRGSYSATPARSSGGTSRRTKSISFRDSARGKIKKDTHNVLDIGNTIENKVPSTSAVLHGKPPAKKPQTLPEPVPIITENSAKDHPPIQSRATSGSNTNLRAFLAELGQGPKHDITAQRNRSALTDIWVNSTTLPNGLDNSGDLDRPRKRSKNVESQSSQAGVNVPSAREASNVHLLSLQEFWTRTTLSNNPSKHLAGPAVPPGFPITDRAFGAFQAHTTPSHHNHAQLGVNDLYVSFTFDKSPHFEFWDMRDDAYFLCAAQINLLATNPSSFRYTSLLLPKISMIDIQCYTQDLNPILSDALPEHVINYTGARTRDDKNNVIPVHPMDGIAVEPEWFRVSRFGGARENNRRGWNLNVYIPIPARLFVKRETRIFVLRTSIWIGDGQEFPVETAQEITVSHLRKEREMP